MLRNLDHYNIETSRPEETVRFYCEVLGCADGFDLRPDVGRPGTWLLVGGHPAIHVNYVDEDPSGSTGALDHVAFEGAGYLAACRRLDDLGVSYQAVESPDIDLMQIYLHDPNQVQIEINIRGEAAAVAAARLDQSD